MSNELRLALDIAERRELRLDDGGTVELRRMRRADRHEVVDFFRRLPAGARPLPADIENPVDVERWIADKSDPPPDPVRLLVETRERIGGWNELGRRLCRSFLAAAERLRAS